MQNNLVIDSGCDIGAKTVEDELVNLHRVPLNLQIGDAVYVDDENLCLDGYLDAMEKSTEAVKTSAPSPSLFLEKFKLGECVFVVTLSSKLSATYQSAMTAKDMYLEEYGKKFIHIFDSLSASIGEGMVAFKVAELAKAGAAATEIVEGVNNFIKDMNTYFILDKFDNLVKTGRIKPYIAKIASFLNIKPICGSENGEIKMVDRARGTAKAIAKLVKIIKENTPDIENRVIGITHVKAYEKAIQLKEEILKHLKPRDIILEECGGITTTYANRGGVIVAL